MTGPLLSQRVTAGCSPAPCAVTLPARDRPIPRAGRRLASCNPGLASRTPCPPRLLTSRRGDEGRRVPGALWARLPALAAGASAGALGAPAAARGAR